LRLSKLVDQLILPFIKLGMHQLDEANVPIIKLGVDKSDDQYILFIEIRGFLAQ
jgi:hypothetical protein